MAFNLATAAGGPTDLLDALFPGALGPISGRSQLPQLAARNDSSVPTVNLFIDGVSPAMKYAASIVDVCGDRTTYALHCSSGPSALQASGVCGASAPTLTITEASTLYRASTTTARSTLGYDVSATIQETCELRGTTAAVCSGTVGGVVNGVTTSAAVSGTISGTDYYRFDVAITAGAEKTANPTGQCKASGASTKAVAMWGLVGVVGVASLLGF
ncbi:hypothetical protein C8A05DRAFT_34800 [Staphylotrichum tortipilum]|uniref:Uncharacterized protein n=1 Tax=Staphylotrichum tortipilum TaxID=2831512 RepID=A0AAN6MK44_9PEZI|nr:hypothetical protein C8A05DRAFT_34800 [Staphylotrichum longicolle]